MNKAITFVLMFFIMAASTAFAADSNKELEKLSEKNALKKSKS